MRAERAARGAATVIYIRKGIAVEAAPRSLRDAIPPEVLHRGRELNEMMHTPFCMWPKEWTK